MIVLVQAEANVKSFGKKNKKIKTIFKVINSIRFQNEKKIKLQKFGKLEKSDKFKPLFHFKTRKSKENGKKYNQIEKKIKFLNIF